MLRQNEKVNNSSWIHKHGAVCASYLWKCRCTPSVLFWTCVRFLQLLPLKPVFPFIRRRAPDEDEGGAFAGVQDSQEVCTTSFSTSPPSQVRAPPCSPLLSVFHRFPLFPEYFVFPIFFLGGGGCLHGLSVSVHWAPPLLKCPSPSLWTVCSSHWLLDLSLTLWVFNWL